MNRKKSTKQGIEGQHLDRLWRLYIHDDTLLATRVSYFLLAQSILIAVTASLVNTIAGFQHHSQFVLRREVFGLSIAINAAGLVLTIVFWYVFTLNFDNVGAVLDMLRDLDPIYLEMRRRQAERRHSHWYYHVIFRKKGMNWVVVNFLPAILVILWCIVGAFALATYFSG